MTICLGMFVEFVAYLDSVDARAERRQALRRWYVAHYCGAHDVVFLRGEPAAYPPAVFARQMHPNAPQVPATTAVAGANG